MIDWTRLAKRLGAAPGKLQVTQLAGGQNNPALRLELESQQYFVKLNPVAREALFVAESRGLDAIRQTGSIRVPEVHLTGSDGEFAYIVMEYLELGGPLDAKRYARALATMHGCVRARFGFDCDNSIGSSPQLNPATDDWIGFWRESRLGFQLELARRNGLDSQLIDGGYRLAERLAEFFPGYRPRPSLLHGDLWVGNQGADADGNPVIFDPSCYFGDHEADLAMMELFGSPGAEFFAAYRELYPLDIGYPLRRDLYNLYHLLNHANLFGGGYPRQAGQVVERLLAQLRG